MLVTSIYQIPYVSFDRYKLFFIPFFLLSQNVHEKNNSENKNKN